MQDAWIRMGHQLIGLLALETGMRKDSQSKNELLKEKSRGTMESPRS